MFFFFFQAEDGIRDRSPSRGLGDVYKRQHAYGGGHISGLGVAVNNVVIQIEMLLGVSLYPPCF